MQLLKRKWCPKSPLCLCVNIHKGKKIQKIKFLSKCQQREPSSPSLKNINSPKWIFTQFTKGTTCPQPLGWHRFWRPAVFEKGCHIEKLIVNIWCNHRTKRFCIFPYSLQSWMGCLNCCLLLQLKLQRTSIWGKYLYEKKPFP